MGCGARRTACLGSICTLRTPVTTVRPLVLGGVLLRRTVEGWRVDCERALPLAPLWRVQCSGLSRPQSHSPQTRTAYASALAIGTLLHSPLGGGRLAHDGAQVRRISADRLGGPLL